MPSRILKTPRRIVAARCDESFSSSSPAPPQRTPLRVGGNALPRAALVPAADEPLLRRSSTGRAAPRPPRRDSVTGMRTSAFTAAVSYRPRRLVCTGSGQRAGRSCAALTPALGACGATVGSAPDRWRAAVPVASRSRRAGPMRSTARPHVGSGAIAAACRLPARRLGARATGRCRQRRISASSASSSRARLPRRRLPTSAQRRSGRSATSRRDG